MDEKLILDYSKTIIDPTIYKFLYALMKYLFYFPKKPKKEVFIKLKNFIGKLKLKIYLKEYFYDDKDYYIDNFSEIMKFIKKQNFMLASEIMENILIRVLSFAFKAEKDDFFGKYLYNNLKTLRDDKKQLFCEKWINSDLIQHIFNNNKLDIVMNVDDVISEVNNNNNEKKRYAQFMRDCPFFHLLIKINEAREIFNRNKIGSDDDKNYSLSKTNFDENTTIYEQISVLFYDESLGKDQKIHKMPATTSTFITTYVYYHNRISPLVNFSKDKEGLENLPFTYDLSEAGINNSYLMLVEKPIRIEPKIEILELNKCSFGFESILELHKAIIFNKSLKKISIKSCSIKSIYLSSFLENLNLFENNNIEELNISSNYLKSDADEYLVKIISSFKKLKTLILSYNNLNCGMGPFFACLKNLYRQKKSELKELFLNNCELDDISFYELGELLKSKYCNLELLCLNENKIPSNSNFFKAIKKNRSLKEIYLYDCGITSDKKDEIDRLISNANLKSLFLYSNKIHDFNQYIRIIYRNSMIKNQYEKENESIFCNNSYLINLNMNNNECSNQNSQKIKLLKKGIERTNLEILDITSVIKYINNTKNNNNNINFKFFQEINDWIKDLQEKKEEFMQALTEINENEIDLQKFKKKTENYKIDYNKIEDIINDKNSKYQAFISKKVKEIINCEKFNNISEKKNEFNKLVNYICLKREELYLSENIQKVMNGKLILI